MNGYGGATISIRHDIHFRSIVIGPNLLQKLKQLDINLISIEIMYLTPFRVIVYLHHSSFQYLSQHY